MGIERNEGRMMRVVGFALMCILLAGCGSHPYVPKEADKQPYDDGLNRQQLAMSKVKVYEVMPAGAKALGGVMAANCGVGLVGKEYEEAFTLIGLKVKAFNKGADGISKVKISIVPDPYHKCEYGFGMGGTAQAFSINKHQ